MIEVSNLRITPKQYQAERHPDWKWVSTCSITVDGMVRIHNLKLKVKTTENGDVCRVQFPIERNADGSIRKGTRGVYESAHPVTAEARTEITKAIRHATVVMLKASPKDKPNSGPDLTEPPPLPNEETPPV